MPPAIARTSQEGRPRSVNRRAFLSLPAALMAPAAAPYASAGSNRNPGSLVVDLGPGVDSESTIVVRGREVVPGERIDIVFRVRTPPMRNG